MALTGIFTLDLDKYARLFLPPKIRGGVVLAYTMSILEGLKEFQNEVFDVKRNEALDFMKPDARVIVFENYLNRYFNITSGEKIYIENISRNVTTNSLYNESEFFGVTTLFNESEGTPSFFSFNESETDQGDSFIVHYPNYIETANELGQLVTQIETYRLFGTQYTTLGYGSSVDPRPPAPAETAGGIAITLTGGLA